MNHAIAIVEEPSLVEIKINILLSDNQATLSIKDRLNKNTA